jgi:fused signal recognition particle receptor
LPIVVVLPAPLTPIIRITNGFLVVSITRGSAWGERTGAPVVARPQGSDAAGLAYDALQAARDAGTDIPGGQHHAVPLRPELLSELADRRGLAGTVDADHQAPVVARPQGSDAAGLAYDALQAARDAGTDILLIDTAGHDEAGDARGLLEDLDLAQRVLADRGVEDEEHGGVDDLEPFAARDFARAIAGLDKT